MRCRRRRRVCWSASGGLSSAQLSWGAASDNVGCGALQRAPRYARAGFTPSLANRIGQPTGTSYTDAVAAGTLLLPGDVPRMRPAMSGPFSNEAAATVGDTQAPSAPGTLVAVGSVGRATLSWARGDRQRRRRALQRPPRHERRLHPHRRQPDRAADRHRLRRQHRPRLLLLQGHGRGRGRQHRRRLERGGRDRDRRHDRAERRRPGWPRRVTGAPSTSAGPPRTDDVAVSRYNLHRGTSAGFTPSPANRIAQPTGTSYADSGLSDRQLLLQASPPRTPPATSAPPPTKPRATIADATPPSAPGTLAAHRDRQHDQPHLDGGHRQRRRHAATTSTAAPRAASPPAPPTGSRNRPGLSYADTGLAPGTYFYKLTAEDAAGNIGPSRNTATATVLDTSPPSTPTLTATGGAGQANLTWTTATDNVAVTRYNLHRSTTSGFTPTTANRIAQPTGTSHTDTGLSRRHLLLQAHRRRRRRQHQHPPATKPAPPSPPHPSPASSPPTASTPAPAPPPPTNPAPATTAPSRTPPGPERQPAATATRSPSTAPTPPSPSPTPPASTSPPA